MSLFDKDAMTRNEFYRTNKFRSMYTNIEYSRQQGISGVTAQHNQAVASAYQTAMGQQAGIQATNIGQGFKGSLNAGVRASLNNAYAMSQQQLMQGIGQVNDAATGALDQVNKPLYYTGNQQANYLNTMLTDYSASMLNNNYEYFSDFDPTTTFNQQWARAQGYTSDADIENAVLRRQAETSKWGMTMIANPNYDAKVAKNAAKKGTEYLESEFVRDSQFKQIFRQNAKGEWETDIQALKQVAFTVDANGNWNINDTGVDMLDQLNNFNSDTGENFKSYLSHLYNTDRDLYDWSAARAIASPNISNAVIATEMISNDIDATYHFAERFGGLTQNQFDNIRDQFTDTFELNARKSGGGIKGEMKRADSLADDLSELHNYTSKMQRFYSTLGLGEMEISSGVTFNSYFGQFAEQLAQMQAGSDMLRHASDQLYDAETMGVAGGIAAIGGALLMIGTLGIAAKPAALLMIGGGAALSNAALTAKEARAVIKELEKMFTGDNMNTIFNNFAIATLSTKSLYEQRGIQTNQN